MRNNTLFCGGLALALLLAIAAPAQAKNVGGKALTCTYAHKNPLHSGTAKLSFSSNLPSAIHFNSYYPGERGALGFTCHIDWKRGDAAVSWHDSPLTTVVTLNSSGDSLALRRDAKRKAYRLDFRKLKQLSDYCGAGAKVPAELLIPLNGKTCAITAP